MKILQFIREGESVKIALFLFIFTVLVNLFLAIPIIHWTQDPTSGKEYRQIAQNIVLGHGYVVKEGQEPVLWRPPLYIYILAFFYSLFKDPYIPIVIFQIILNGITGVLLFFIGKKIFSQSVAFFAALLFPIYPLSIYCCTRTSTETLFTFLVSITVLLTIDLFRGTSWRRSLILGLFLGLAALTRVTIQFFPIFLILATMLWVKERGKRYGILKELGIVIPMMILTVFPWTLRNYSVSKEWIFIDTSGGYTFWVGNRIASDGVEDFLNDEKFAVIRKEVAKILDIPYTEPFHLEETAWGNKTNGKKLYWEAIKGMIESPFQTFILWMKKLCRFWFYYDGVHSYLLPFIILLQLFLMIPAGFGIYFALKEKKPILVLLLIISFFWLVHSASLVRARYSIPIFPYITLFAVNGVRGWIRKKQGRAVPHPL